MRIGALIDSKISMAERDGSGGNNADLRREALSAEADPKSTVDHIEAMAETGKALGFTPMNT